MRAYTGARGRGIARELVRTALTSRADLAIVPMQDLLELPGSARMNVPGTPTGNWEWRLAPGERLPPTGWLEALLAVSDRAGPRAR